jgi:hypothetical protein
MHATRSSMIDARHVSSTQRMNSNSQWSSSSLPLSKIPIDVARPMLTSYSLLRPPRFIAREAHLWPRDHTVLKCVITDGLCSKCVKQPVCVICTSPLSCATPARCAYLDRVATKRWTLQNTYTRQGKGPSIVEKPASTRHTQPVVEASCDLSPKCEAHCVSLDRKSRADGHRF